MKKSLLALLSLVVILGGCGGGGGGGGGGAPADIGGGNDLESIPAGKVRVDGHIINSSFNVDGTSYSVFISYFDNNGKLSSYHELLDWEGNEATSLFDFRFTYDNNGVLTNEEEEFTYTREGLRLYNHVFTQTRHTYDIKGNIIKSEREFLRADRDGDGDYDDGLMGLSEITTYTYDTISQLSTLVVNQIHDGEFITSPTSTKNSTTSYKYDSLGNVIKETLVKGNLTGTPNSCCTTTTLFEYDGNNRKIKEIYYSTISRFSTNLISSITLFTYNESGLLIKKEIDNNTPRMPLLDNTVDGFSDIIFEFKYGTSGELIEESKEQIFISHSEKETTRYFYEIIDADDDGTPESTLTYKAYLGKVSDVGGGFPAHIIPDWVTVHENSINTNAFVPTTSDSNDETGGSSGGSTDSDGWGLNWEGHGRNCSRCGNMIGQVNRILVQSTFS